VPRIAVVLALTGLMAVPAVAGAAAANTVTVVGSQTSLHQSGNSVTFTETLRLGRNAVGTDKVTCNGVSGNIYNCRAKYTLSNGTITAAGRYNQARVNNQIRITGGTGAYAGATGALKLHNIGRTNRTQETFVFAS
jgi:Allene oxide cyclase barrel like domain